MLEHKMASQTTDEKAGGDHPHPAVLWAQRKDKIYLTIQLDSVSNPEIKLEENNLYFKGAGGPKQVVHEANIAFYDSIIPEESKKNITGREVVFMLKKKNQEAPYWPRILKENKKVHFIKTDFNKWRDEDDSDVDESEDMNLEQMMSSMGGLGNPDMAGLGAGPEEDEDSDDEDLPDLQ